MKIVVAGPGCPRCISTEKNVQEAVKDLNLDAEIEYLKDPLEFSKLGVMLTPAVIVDGKVVVSGRIPTVEDLKKILSEF